MLSIKPSYKPPSKVVELKLEAYGAAAGRRERGASRRRGGEAARPSRLWPSLRKPCTSERHPAAACCVIAGAAATLGYKANGGSLVYKLEASQEIADGREIEVELDAEGVEVSLSDSTVEQGATWTATLSTPFSSPLSDSELVLRRSMAF